MGSRFGTTPRTISTSSRSCCPPDSGGRNALLRQGFCYPTNCLTNSPTLTRLWNTLQNPIEDFIRIDSFGFSLKAQDDAMSERAQSARPDIVRRHVNTIVQESTDLCADDHRLRRARAGAMTDEFVRLRVSELGVRMRRHHDPDCVFLYGPRNGYCFHCLPHFQNLRTVEDAIYLRLLSFGCAIQNRVKAGQSRIVHLQLHEETVELRFGQRVRSFHFQRVLRR